MIFIQVVRDPNRPHERETFTAKAPATVAEVLPSGFEDLGTRAIFVNGVRCTDEQDVLGDRDSVMIVGQYGSGAVVLQIMIALASALIARSLMHIPEQVDDGQDSYGFKGFTNSYLEGGAVPLVYGYTRVAPPVIAQSIESAWSAYVLGRQERMRLLFAVSDGPIYGFGDVVGEVTSDADLAALPAIADPLITAPLATRIGLKVNGQDAANFDDVTVSWRTGTLNQDPPKGWADTSIDVTIDQELPEVTGIDEASKPPGTYTAGNEITASAGDFAGYTMVDVADRAEIVFDFLRGLYKQDSSGAVVDSSASFRVQTWPVDSGGTRTGDTTIMPEFHFTDNTQSQETVTVPIDLYDSANYTPPIGQGYLASTGASDYAKITAPVDPACLPDNYAFGNSLKFTASAWVRIDDLIASANVQVFRSSKGSATASSVFPYSIQGSAGSDAGVEFAIITDNLSTAYPVHLVLHGWAAGNYLTKYSNPVATALDLAGKWTHVGVTWDGSSSGVTFYLNGVAVAGANTASLGSTKPTFHVENDFEVAKSLCDIADFQLLQGLHSEAIIANAAALDKYGHALTNISKDSPYTRCAAHFDTTLASAKVENLFFPASTTVGQVFDLVGSPLQATPQTDPAVYSAEVGYQTEGRYRIEVFRSNPVIDEPGTEVNACAWKLLKLIEDEDFERPGLATASVDILADDQVSNSRPNMTMLCAGRLVDRWDGSSTEFPTFVTEWTRNPAWICLDLLTDVESGMGAIYDKYKNIDLAAWKVWADYCDEGVEDAQGTPNFWGASASAATSAHPNGTITIKIGILDAAGAATGDTVPQSWAVGTTVRIKTASDSAYVTTSSDSIRLAIYDLHYESDDLAPDGYQHWAAVSMDWTADLTLPTASGVTGTAVGFEARHEFDLAFDSKTALGWDEIQVPMKAARAFPVRFGGTLSVFVDRARSPVAMFTMANIIEGSFELGWTGIDDRPNAIEIEYQDRAHDFDSEMLSVAHPSVAGSDDVTAERRERVKLRGVTRRTEVIRHAYYRLNQNNLLRRTCSFSAGLDAVAVAPGDRIRIAHDVVYYGESGRVWVDSPSATEIALDRDITLTAGKTYEIEVRSSGSVGAANSELRETVSIDASEIPGSGSTTISAGTSITLTSPGFATFTPKKADIYSFGETGTTAEDFAIVSASLNPETMTRKFECVEYNAAVYDDNTWGSLPTDPSEGLDPPQPQGGPPTTKPPGGDHGTFASATETSVRDSSGKPFPAVDIVLPPVGQESMTGGTDLWVSDLSNGAVPVPRLLMSVPAGRRSIRVDTANLVAGNTYRFHFQRRASGRAARAPQASPSVDLYVSGNVPVPDAPTVSAPHTRGTNAVYGIEFPTGQRPEGVEVRVGGWIMGQKLAADLRDGELVSESWVYGPTNSVGDSALDHYVRSLLPNGQVSDAATFQLSASAPLGGTVASSTAHEDAWASGTLSGLQIDSSTTPPFLKFSGSGTEGTFTTPALDMGSAKRYYVEVAAQCWQDDGATWSSVGGTWGDRKNLNRTWEGATGGPGVEVSKIELQWSPSTTGTPVTLFSAFKPGIAYFRSAKFRIVVTRPDSSYDCILERFGVRVIELPDFEPGDIDGGSF